MNLSLIVLMQCTPVYLKTRELLEQFIKDEALIRHWMLADQMALMEELG